MKRLACMCLFGLLLSSLATAADKKPIKVFVLAGQSNMEGKAKVSLLDYQVAQPATKDKFAHWQKDGQWIERDDVQIKFLDRAGKLTVGFGSPKCIGPELEFGRVVGDRYEEPILLIKTAWGGRSLVRDFRSPSAGLPADEVLQKALTEMQKKKPAATLADVKEPYGASYRAMLKEVGDTLADLKKYFPDQADRGYELAGFIWHQGWNDMINAEATAEYTQNLQHFIRDVRKDLKSPQLPFVICQMGIDGDHPSASIQKFKEAQAAVLDEPAFKGNVSLVKTDLFWDTEAEAVYKKGWSKHIDEWNKVGSDFPFHDLGSCKTLFKMGEALGQSVLELRGDAK